MGIFGWILAFFITVTSLERLWPRWPGPLRRREAVSRLLRNLTLGAFYRGWVAVFLIAPALALAIRFQPWHRPAAASAFVALAWLGDLLVLDLLNYVTHRMSHRYPVLWRFHAVHHLDQHLDASTGLRAHFGEKLAILPMKLFLVWALAMPLAHLAAFEALTLLGALFHHSNLRLPSRLEAGISRLITTPAFHGVHHHAELPYTDSNYGFVLSIWDVCFGTLSVRSLGSKLRPGLNQHVGSGASVGIGPLFARPFFRGIAGSSL